MSGRTYVDGKPRFAAETAAAVRAARMKQHSVRAFADRLVVELHWASLSRQAIYDWESGQVSVPSVVLLASAAVSGLTVDQLLEEGKRFIKDAAAGSAYSTDAARQAGGYRLPDVCGWLNANVTSGQF
jgi:transcriptional regulator with XRE-family HTH domain